MDRNAPPADCRSPGDSGAGLCPAQLAGISLQPGAAAPELQHLASRARAGDKHALLELGTRYEEGAGVPQDLHRAARLYGLAARSTGGTIYVYSPPVGNQRYGGVIPVNTGPPSPGLPAAQKRLQAVEAQLAAARQAGSER